LPAVFQLAPLFQLGVEVQVPPIGFFIDFTYEPLPQPFLHGS